ncbi:MAG: hypothetical protein MJZ50_05195 [Treponema sp.]|nr:hypothetical protein [Treponema sp.]
MQIKTTEITTVSDAPVRVGKIPGENEKVYTRDETEYELREILNSGGGEGTIYKTNLSNGLVAKIYKEGKVTRRKEAKLQFMVSNHLHHEGICFPVDLLYNQRGEFVGYLMPLAKGDTLKNSFFGKPQFLDHFSDWKKYDVVELALTILKKMKYLHDRGIFIGDIKGENILVVDSKEVYFVDTDSYQVGNFPCPVISEEFTPPELIGRKCDSVLRTAGNENFAVATLLFKIVMQGINPYAHVGGGSPLENIQKMNFSFPFGKSNFQTPGGSTGSYYCCWDHLSMKIREAFYNTFSRNGSTNSEFTRPDVNKWIEIFEFYDYYLRNRLSSEDESNKVYPTELRIKKGQGIFCKAGQHYVREKGFSERGRAIGVCRECLGASFENRSYSCKCGNAILYTGFDHYIKRLPVPVNGESECNICNPKSGYITPESRFGKKH